MSERPKCSGNCRLCTDLGICPADHATCEDCGAELEPGEGIEIEVESVERGRHGTKMITVCAECFVAYYQGDETIEYEY